MSEETDHTDPRLQAISTYHLIMSVKSRRIQNPTSSSRAQCMDLTGLDPRGGEQGRGDTLSQSVVAKRVQRCWNTNPWGDGRTFCWPKNECLPSQATADVQGARRGLEPCPKHACYTNSKHMLGTAQAGKTKLLHHTVPHKCLFLDVANLWSDTTFSLGPGKSNSLFLWWGQFYAFSHQIRNKRQTGFLWYEFIDIFVVIKKHAFFPPSKVLCVSIVFL